MHMALHVMEKGLVYTALKAIVLILKEMASARECTEVTAYT